jgi:hypothetical protein
MAEYYGDLNDLLRRARQKYAYGQNIPASSLKAMTAGAIEAKGARTLSYAQLAQQKAATDAQAAYQTGMLGVSQGQLELQKRAQKAESVGGYVQGLASVGQFATSEAGKKLLTGAGKLVGIGKTTPTVSPSVVSPSITSGISGGVGAAPVGITGVAPTKFGGAALMAAPEEAMYSGPASFGAPASVGGTVNAFGGAANLGGQAGLGQAGSLGSGLTAGTAGGAGTGAGSVLSSGLASAGGGLLAGWGAQKLTKAGEEGHKGGEVATGQVLGAGGGFLAGAAIGSVLPGVGTIIGGVIGGLTGMFGGGGGKK